MFLKKILIILLFVLFFVAIGFLALQSYRKGGKNPTPNYPVPTGVPIGGRDSIPGQKPEFKPVESLPDSNSYSVVFNLGNNTTLPPSVQYVSVKRNIDQSFIDALKKRFSISGEPKNIDGMLSWDGSKSMTINPASGYVQFTSMETVAKSDPGGTQNTTVNKTDAEALASTLLRDLGIINVTPNSASVRMFSGLGDSLTETQNESQATIYEIVYSQSFQGVPIYYQLASEGKITVHVDVFGQIRGVWFFYIQPTDVRKNSPVDLESIKNNAINGGFVIVDVEGENKTLPREGVFRINSLDVVYFDDKTSGSLFPVALLRGVVNPGNKNVSAYSLLETP